MEELENIIKAVAGLPDMAIYGLLMFFAYKTVIVGSVYGVIRFTVQKVHDVMVFRRTPPPVDKLTQVKAVVIDNAFDELMAQLCRLRGKHLLGSKAAYIHRPDVEWLSEAITAKEVAEERAVLARKEAA